MILVHDFAYSDTAFDGYKPPSVLQVPGAKEVSVELYTLTKSYSMAGWRAAFMVGNRDVVAALTKLKSYLDYGTFQPIQIAANDNQVRSDDASFQIPPTTCGCAGQAMPFGTTHFSTWALTQAIDNLALQI